MDLIKRFSQTHMVIKHRKAFSCDPGCILPKQERTSSLRKISKCLIFASISRLYRPPCNSQENSLPLLHKEPLLMQCFICSLILLLFERPGRLVYFLQRSLQHTDETRGCGPLFLVVHVYFYESNLHKFIYFFQTAQHKYSGGNKY